MPVLMFCFTIILNVLCTVHSHCMPGEREQLKMFGKTLKQKDQLNFSLGILDQLSINDNTTRLL